VWQHEAGAGFDAQATAAAEYWGHHPYLTPSPPLPLILPLTHTRADADALPPDAEQRAAEQAYLDAVCAQLQGVLDAFPARRFGYTPARNNLLGLLTSQFMHGGWVHIVFNMWFLWLCGCNLEDRWGRLVFLPFYLSAGAVACIAQKIAEPASAVPIIGASGAIAGAMGAFLVSFATTKIRFVYWLFIRVGSFSAPAYVMLPLWVLWELLYGVLVGSKDGVAHWVHVGGFVYGAAFALVLRATGTEKRLDAAVERTVSIEQDPRIMRAADLTTAGRPLDALAMLDAVAGERPDDIDVQLETLRAAKAAADARREGQAYARLVRLYFDAGLLEPADDLLTEAQGASLDVAVPAELRVRLADRLVVKGLPERAWTAYATLTRAGLADEWAVRAAIAQSKLAHSFGRRQEARALLGAVLESPFSSAEMDEAARAELGRLGAPA
jgi:membrane associated rhomboid family serine protease